MVGNRADILVLVFPAFSYNYYFYNIYLIII